ncbi:MAG TPA: tRNA 2-thiouridine(34) synthase MnmA [Anaerolineae bacterium]|nr:tRNA 2-thiouridine(34) synthase MnmA [Anaerolineae bacterium]
MNGDLTSNFHARETGSPTSSLRVVVALSGGVDSSVAAALLREQGYDVVGLMLKLWSDGDAEPGRTNRCCTPADVDAARTVANQLGIPFYLINIADSFKATVVDYFIAEYAAGRTPNPCLMCNRHIRYELLLNKALSLGARYLATGHYARVRETDGQYQLLRGVDAQKDQSYVLSVLGQHELAHALWPLGELTKPQVRELAARFMLPVAEKVESQDLCFLANGDYRDFLTHHAPDGSIRPGEIRDTSGKVLGEHGGLPFYTIGQRKGIGLAAPEPLYVIALEAADNAVIVGPLRELGRRHCTAREMHYVSGVLPSEPFRASAKIRYKAREAAVTVQPQGSRAQIEFDEPQRDITPGQGVVLFDGEIVRGQGFIE